MSSSLIHPRLGWNHTIHKSSHVSILSYSASTPSSLDPTIFGLFPVVSHVRHYTTKLPPRCQTRKIRRDDFRLGNANPTTQHLSLSPSAPKLFTTLEVSHYKHHHLSNHSWHQNRPSLSRAYNLSLTARYRVSQALPSTQLF